MARRYVYLMTEAFNPTVIDSQVIEPMTLLADRNVRFDLIVPISAGMLLRQRETIRERAAEAERRIAGRVAVLPSYAAHTHAGAAAAAALAIARCPRSFAARELVIHARGYNASSIGLAITRVHPGARLVADIRGHIAEYAMMAERGDRGAEKMAEVAPARLRAALRGASAVICVSGPMRDWLVGELGARPEMVRVVPCLANDALFRPDPARRKEVRRREGLTGRSVVVFPGATGRWHYLPETLTVVRTLMEQSDDVFFLALTPNEDDMRAAIAAAGLPVERTRALRVAHHEVPAWLDAADAGILLRERHPVNAVAAPTKFAEYLLMGLPVLINPGIGDYSDFVRQRDVGVLLDEHDPSTYVDPFRRLMSKRDDGAQRARIAGIGRAHFAKETRMGELAEMYRTVETRRALDRG